MTDRQPSADILPAQRDEVSGGRPESTQAVTGGIALGADPAVAGMPGLDLAYESGVEVKARSQWAYVRMRFFRHRLAVISLVVLILIALVGAFAPQIAPYGFDELDLTNVLASPTPRTTTCSEPTRSAATT